MRVRTPTVLSSAPAYRGRLVPFEDALGPARRPELMRGLVPAEDLPSRAARQRAPDPKGLN